MPDFAHSVRAQEARMVKADKIANFILGAAGTWPETDTDRRKVEKLAGVRPSSTETWDLARRFYDDLRASRERATA